MHVLHGSWLITNYPAKDKGFVVWAEASETSEVRLPRLSRKQVRPHPFAASTKTLRRALLDLLPAADILMRGAAKDTKAVVHLPSTSRAPQASPQLVRDADEARGTPSVKLAAWRVEALSVPADAALGMLAALPLEADTTPGIKVGSDLRYWQHAGKWVLELLAQQRFKPVLIEEGLRYLAVWQPQFDQADRARFDQLAQAMPPLCRSITREADSDPKRAPLPQTLLDNFVSITLDAFARRRADFARLDPKRSPSVAEAWLNALWNDDPLVKESFPTLTPFYEQYRAWAELITGAGGDTFRLCFRLDPPTVDQDARGIVAPKASQRDWSLRYFLQATDDLSLLVPAELVWKERGSTLKFLNRKFAAPQEHLLAGLGQASRIFPPIEASLRAARPADCALNVEQAYTFMRETSLLMEASGFGVLVPGLGGKLGVRVNLKSKAQPAAKGGVSSLSFESVIAYDWQLALGGEPLSPAEFEKLAALKVPLVQVRGQWIELKPDQVEQAIKFWEKRQRTEDLSVPEALRIALTMESGSAVGGLPITHVVTEGWIDDLLKQLAGGAKMQPVATPLDFHGTLRPYQSIGLAWLAFLRQWNLGGCLADDMGLGKCVSADTRLYVNGSLQTAERLWEEHATKIEFDGEGYWSAPEQLLNVNSLDTDLGCLVQARVSRMYRQFVTEKVKRVTLADGSQIVLTSRHQLLTPQGWTREFQIGDYLCVPAHLIWKGEPVDTDLVTLLAWQIAEGYEQAHVASLHITQADVTVLQELKDVFQRVAARHGFGANVPTVKTYAGRAADLRINSASYRRFLESKGYAWGKRSRDKSIPDFIMQADNETIRVFLRNYFDAEGSASLRMRSVEISSASQQLVQQVSTLLRRFGIWLRVSAKRKRATNGTGTLRTYFIGVLGGESARRFQCEVGFGVAYKQQTLATICAQTCNTNVEGIPASRSVANLVAETGLPLKHLGMYNTVYINGSQEFSRNSLRPVVEALERVLSGDQELAYRALPSSKWTARTLQQYAQLDKARVAQDRDDLRRLMDQEVFYCKVKSIEEIDYQGWVYDFEVEHYHNFVANNIICHNTIQVIALLLHERQTSPPSNRPALLICPTSVVGNWQHELARFAPDLRVLAYHGATRNKDALSEQAARHDVVVSSYALLHRDAEQLGAIAWGDVILDEAQNIKNPSTKQAQAARRLQAQWRVALTGTPVENRLMELWSLFQFLNPDYLGSQKDFLDRLARPIERANDAAATQRLRALVGPFILRRMKTDPAVISDLPDKNEMKVYCSLTKEQATLYQAVVHDSLLKIQATEGIDRRGVILGTLLKLKQVCNHPAQFLGDGSALPKRSGKLMRLTEMLEEVRAVKDRALIFTQFAEMGKLLKAYLQDTFGDEVFFLHGGVPAKQRDQLVNRFQNDPNGPLAFILSIKAGGTGLNLTRANHVFHFDRWWNPAVENQATDRAFRIGQTKNVQVHKFLCAGTFEEKIDDLIERKQALAESIVGTSEGWITELSTEQLKDLFALRKEAVGDE